MILSRLRCDRCDVETEPLDSDEYPEGWLRVVRWAEDEEEDLLLHFCSWGCAMHACATADLQEDEAIDK